MADDANPFSDIFSGSATQPAPTAAPTEEANPFADIMKPETDTSVGGTFMHSLERGFAPAVASLPAMGAGAEIGATIGSPGGPIGVGIGGIVGGLAGAFAGSEAVSAAQQWALSQLPESWQDMLGQSAKQQQAEAEKQSVASFLGGLVPYALTMRPSFNMATAALPENATAIQRLMANPLTAHIFGGAVTGGMELGTEAANHESPDWTKISIATAFGTIFNKPTRLGEALTEVGARPARALLGRPEPVAPAVAPEQPAKPPEAAPAQPAVKPPGISEKEWNETLLGQKPEPQPTVAQAGDAKVLGPGIDEAVFMGAHEQAPEALMTAQDTARTEASVLRPEESAPSVGTVARRMEPDLFTQYDALQAQRDDLASHPDAPAVQQHIDATNAQINALGPQVAAAYRRAADVVQSPTVEPEVPTGAENAPVAQTSPSQVPESPSNRPSKADMEAQQAAIAQQVTANLIAAGRSPEEAAAGGQLLGHYYRTRSQKFKGALGSPMELFNQQGPTIRRYGASVAPLMPTEARPTIAPEKAPEIIPQNIPGEIAQQPQAVGVHEIAPELNASRGPAASEVEALDPSNIGVDATRFQFKAGGDEQGVSERLQGIKKWEPPLAGMALVFRDAEGRNWVADGHQRVGLAKRLMAEGHPPIKINAFVLDAKDGITDADARAIAAVKNIAEGTGSAIDAAKVLRAAKETGIQLPELPSRSALVRDGTALAELGPEAFGIVVNEAVPFQQGAIVGRLVKNPDQQVEALRLLAAIKPENVTQAEMVVRDMLSSGTEMTTQGTLFGDEAFASSIVRERAKIADESLKLLRRDKQTFRTLVDEAERIQGAGANVLDQTANQGRLSTDEQAADFLKQLAFRAGPVSDALSAVARQLKAGEIKPGDAARSFLESVRRAVESGVVEGTDAGGAEPGAGGQRQEGPELFQSVKDDDRNLFVAHNIKPDGLLNAAKIGGLPLPSLAIARADRGGFEGFGEISLIGDRDMVDPRLDSAARVHNTDAYSPRYPGVNRTIDDAAFNAINKPIVADIKTLGGGASDGIDLSGLEDRGLTEARRRPGVEYAFIKEKGLPFKPVTKEDGTPDWGGNLRAIREAMAGHENEFADWADAKLSPLIQKERIFKGFTDMGNRRYVEHTLQNAYADMKSRLKEGENWNYGVGSIRARWSKVYKSITGVTADRENIVRQEDIEPIKKAFDDRFFAMVEEMKPYYRFDGEGMRYLEDVSSMMAEMASKGARVLDEGFKDLPPELVTKVREFGADLASAPTAYFEAKLNRTVGLDEFRAALVPKGTRQSVLDALAKYHVQAYEYDPNVPGSRTEALQEVQDDREGHKILFQSRKPEPWRPGEMFGGFDTERGLEGLPQTLIPGVKPMTDAERLAAEAAKPLKGGAAPPKPGSLFDEQGREDSAAQRELFQPAYHGTPHIFDKFDSSKIGTGEGAQAFGHGLYFAGRKEVAKYYRDTLAGREDPYEWQGEKWDSNALAKRISNAVGDSNSIAVLGALRDIRNGFTREQVKSSLSEKHAPMVDFLFDGGIRSLEPNKGRLLHVDVPEPHELLDWDKPLSEQPESVQSHFTLDKEHKEGIYGPPRVNLRFDGRTITDLDAAGGKYLTGQMVYNALSETLGSDAAASTALREAGIPGHRFLDQQSRNPQALADARGSLAIWEKALEKTPDDAYIKGEVEARRADVAKLEAEISHNYVIYDDSRVNILNYEQRKRAAIQFAPGRKPLIKLFADADASSFFHEAGHQWLEDMMRDAVHPSAPGSLKDDALTVREALGMKPDQTSPTTRQHERWARWTEQYLREGVAPSPGLARVFAQLRTWLTQIYQSIKGLGTPINEDIRGVFDRLLAEEPNRTVISPEDLAREPSLPSIHEAEAAEAAPHEAHGIGDRIVAERDDYLSRQPPEVQNEIEAILQKHQEEAARAAGTEPAAEAGASTGGPAAVVGGGIESGAEPAGGAGGGERGPQLGGGSNGVSESAGPTTPGEPTDNAGLRQQRPGTAGATGAHALAPTPSTLFGPAESPFVDKAGNIRIENLTSDQDVAQAIRDAAQENNDFIGDRRGVITDGQVLDLADALGMTAESLNRRKLGEAFSAEQVVAARKLLIQSATDVRDVMAKAAAPTSTDEDVLAYAHAKARHQMIQAQVAGITAEAGRALRAFRSLVGDAEAVGMDQFLRSATGKTLFQLKEEAKLGSQLDTPMKVSKFVRDAQKRGFGSMILEYWINGLISGPATHTTYMVGNVILSLHKAGPETLAAALIGSAARAAGRKGEVVNFGEAAAKLRGAHLGIPAATQAAFDALRTGVTTRLPGETPRVLPFQPGSELARSVGINESARYSDAMPALYGAVQGIQDGIVSLGTLLKAGGVQGAPMVGLRYSPLGAIPDIAVRGVDVLPLGTVARIPSRAIAAIHSFFRTVNYSMEKNALAYRSAIASGKTGVAFDAHVANMRQNPTPDMMESAVKQATDATLMGRGSEFVQALGKLTNVKILGFPFLKFVDPFVHISGNIIDQSIVQRTPLGLLAPEIRADLMGKNGTVAQDTAAARMLVGTALSIGFGSLAAQGLMSGSGPSDPRQAAVWRLAGNQAHSARINDIWYDVHRLGPMGMLASVAADMYDVAHGASEGDMGKMGAALLQAFTHTMLDEGFGRGPADLIQALTDPQRYGPSYVRNQIASFVPFSVGMGQVARAMDPYARQARSIMDQIKSKVPGLSETLLPRRDIWGQPLPSTEVFGTPGLSAIYTTQVNNDPVNQALLNLSIYPAQVDHAIRGVPLTDEQFDQYATIAGGMAKQRLDLIVRSPQWSTWPASTQHDIVESTISQSREVARNVVMGHWPQIASDAVRGRLQQLQPSTSEE